MKQITVALLIICSFFLSGCSRKLEGSYKWTGLILDQPSQVFYDFNADGSVVWTSAGGTRSRGTYSISGNKIVLDFPTEGTKELVREGDALMQGNSRFTRQ